MAKSNPSNVVQDDEDSVRTLNARKRIRDQLEAVVEAFLSNGGAIQKVEVNATADPPTKPVSRYGGRPI